MTTTDRLYQVRALEMELLAPSETQTLVGAAVVPRPRAYAPDGQVQPATAEFEN